ncbi:SufE-like protein 1, chloroplastic/mitochondrial [Linum perenne]
MPSVLISKSISFQTIETTTKKQSRSPVSVSASDSTSLQPIEELPPKLQEIVKLFQSAQEPKAKYEQLFFYGKNFKALDVEFKTKENKVQGCVSQVWVRAYLDDERNVLFDVDSNSVLMKGLAVLLVQGLSGMPVNEIVRVPPDFDVLLGVNQSLTPSRNNGFLNMLKLMQKKAIELYVVAKKGIESAQSSNLDELSSEAGNVQTNGDAQSDNLVINGVDND